MVRFPPTAAPSTPQEAYSSLNSLPQATNRQTHKRPTTDRSRPLGASSPNATLHSKAPDTNQVFSGKIIWYNPNKGYGFIACPELDCILFAPGKSIKGQKLRGRLFPIPAGCEVEFEIVDGKPHLKARNITGPGGKLLVSERRSSSVPKKRQVRMTRDQHPHPHLGSQTRSSSV